MNMIHRFAIRSSWLILFLAMSSIEALAQEISSRTYDPAQWTNIRMVKLPGEINSEVLETVSCFNPAGDTLYFGTKRETGRDQLWACEYRGGQFLNPVRVTNIARGAIGAVTIDRFGNAYLAAVNDYTRDHPNNVDICEIDSFGQLRLLPGAINTMSWESQPHISRGGDTLFFAAAITPRNGSTNVDIYTSSRIEGTWSEAKELEGSVNTRAYEGFPTLSPDGQYLFFMRRSSSNSPRMMYAKFSPEDQEWDDDEDLPSPINTKKEMTIAFHPTERMFVIASARGDDDKNFDLYEVRYDIKE
jgi:hypothetical protein